MVQQESAPRLQFRNECVSLSFYVKGASPLKNGKKEQGSQVDNEAQGMDAKSGQKPPGGPPLPRRLRSRDHQPRRPFVASWSSALLAMLSALHVVCAAGAARAIGVRSPRRADFGRGNCQE